MCARANAVSTRVYPALAPALRSPENPFGTSIIRALSALSQSLQDSMAAARSSGHPGNRPRNFVVTSRGYHLHLDISAYVTTSPYTNRNRVALPSAAQPWLNIKVPDRLVRWFEDNHWVHPVSFYILSDMFFLYLRMNNPLDMLSSRTRIEWLSSLDTESRPDKNYRRTSIIGTIGELGSGSEL